MTSCMVRVPCVACWDWPSAALAHIRGRSRGRMSVRFSLEHTRVICLSVSTKYAVRRISDGRHAVLAMRLLYPVELLPRGPCGCSRWLIASDGVVVGGGGFDGGGGVARWLRGPCWR